MRRTTLQISLFNFWTSLTRDPRGVTTSSTSSTSFPWLLLSAYPLQRIPGGALSRSIFAHFPNCLLQSQNSSPGATAPERPNVAHRVDMCGVSHLGGPKLRACNSYAGGLDRFPRTALFLVGRTTALATAAPEPPGSATNSVG